MTVALIEQGVVTNVINAPDGWVDPAGAQAVSIPEGADVALGWAYAGGVFLPPPAVAPTKDALIAYANAKQTRAASGGITVNVAASGAAAINIEVDTNDAGRINLTGAVQLSSLAPSTTFNWAQASGAVVLTAAQIQTLGQAAAAFVQHTFTVLGEALAAINAGTITTLAEIDALAWPLNS